MWAPLIVRGTQNPWIVTAGFDYEVDFCVWVLESEGILVPPFDRHVGGQGDFRSKGLSPESWRSWVEAVVAAQARRSQIMRQAGERDTRSRKRGVFGLGWKGGQSLLSDDDVAEMKGLRPAAVWSGSPEVRDGLKERWEQYGPLSTERKRRVLQLDGDRYEALCSVVGERASEIPSPLTVYLVDYPGPRHLCLPSPAALLGSCSWSPNVQAFRDYTRRATDDIVAAGGHHFQPN